MGAGVHPPCPIRIGQGEGAPPPLSFSFSLLYPFPLPVGRKGVGANPTRNGVLVGLPPHGAPPMAGHLLPPPLYMEAGAPQMHTKISLSCVRCPLP